MIPSVARAPSRSLTARLVVLVTALALVLPAAAAGATGTYQNPLEPSTSIGTGIVESCADPSVIRGQEDEGYWYMYCTSDPLNDEDRNASGGFNFRLLPVLRSRDLVNWEYVGDALTARPSYAQEHSGIWAPEIKYYPETGKYHLYFTVVDTTGGYFGSAIGVAVSDTAEGPFTPVNTPVVEPHGADCCGPDSRRHVFDPEVLRTAGPDYIYYGSYFGGVSVRVLSEDGFTSDPATQTNVAIANKYEGPEVVHRDGWYYLFVSATDCCRGPLTGYAVFVGRSQSPTGPFLDRSGVDLNDDEPHEDDTDGRAGGSPVIVGNDDPWVGPGHNTVFQDLSGQWWTIYHAIDRNEPYFEGGVDIFEGNCGAEGQSAQPCGDLNKRPALLDAIDWIGGWPTLNGGMGISTTPQQAPAAQPGDKTNHRAPNVREDKAGQLIAAASDEFSGTSLASRWSWIRQPAAGTYGISNGRFWMDTQAADLFVDSNNASVLVENAPKGNFMVETRVRLNVPAEGCCFNYVQAGLVLHADDDNYLKLTHASIWNTRQTEWAKEMFPVPDGYPRYGNSVVGPPGGVVTTPTASPLGEWTQLRIVRRLEGGKQHYTAWTRAENGVWEKGMTWVHDLGKSPRIGLVAMGGSGFRAEFDYVRVYNTHR
ncbi:MAG TPA: family 43 glycosylhydrolase [Vitreimonas sp.]|nr:family 43 glycosylhydrolase [Vitreimonas sp.]